MFLPKLTIKYIEEDLLKVLLWLKSKKILYRLDDIESIKKEIYYFYNSHSKSTVKESLEIFKTQLFKTHSNLQRIRDLIFIGEEKWFRYYFFDPDNKSLLNSCNYRIYLNPRIERFDIITDIARYYSDLPQKTKKPFYFKFVSPNYVAKRHLERSDKIVLYLSKEGDLVPIIEDKLKSFPVNYFNSSTPLFTHRIRAGIGWAYSPKGESVFIRVIRGYAKDVETEISYGEYMSYLIAIGLKTIIINNGIKKDEREFIDFSTLSDSQIGMIYKNLINFVINRANQDLHI